MLYRITQQCVQIQKLGNIISLDVAKYMYMDIYCSQATLLCWLGLGNRIYPRALERPLVYHGSLENTVMCVYISLSYIILS